MLWMKCFSENTYPVSILFLISSHRNCNCWIIQKTNKKLKSTISAQTINEIRNADIVDFLFPGNNSLKLSKLFTHTWNNFLKVLIFSTHGECFSASQEMCLFLICLPVMSTSQSLHILDMLLFKQSISEQRWYFFETLNYFTLGIRT